MSRRGITGLIALQVMMKISLWTIRPLNLVLFVQYKDRQNIVSLLTFRWHHYRQRNRADLLKCGSESISLFANIRRKASVYSPPARISSANRLARVFSLVKDLRCARASPEARVGATNPNTGDCIKQLSSSIITGH